MDFEIAARDMQLLDEITTKKTCSDVHDHYDSQSSFLLSVFTHDTPTRRAVPIRVANQQQQSGNKENSVSMLYQLDSSGNVQLPSSAKKRLGLSSSSNQKQRPTSACGASNDPKGKQASAASAAGAASANGPATTPRPRADVVGGAMLKQLQDEVVRLKKQNDKLGTDMKEKLGRADSKAEKTDRKAKHLESENQRLMQILADQEAEMSALRGQRDAALTKLRQVGGGGSGGGSSSSREPSGKAPGPAGQPALQAAPASAQTTVSSAAAVLQCCNDQDVAILSKLHARMEELSLKYGKSGPTGTRPAQLQIKQASSTMGMEVRSPTGAAAKRM